MQGSAGSAPPRAGEQDMTVTVARILQDVRPQATQSHDELMAEIVALREANERLKAGAQRGLTLKVSDKGALSVYGMGRFPVTLYRGQWEKLAKALPQIEQFIQDNADRLATKD